MKTIVFYGRTRGGMIIVSHLVALGYKVKVIPEDELVIDIAKMYNLESVNLETMGEFDLFLCAHGKKIIPEAYLKSGKYVNIHPCLFKYKGTDPIARYMKNKDTQGSIESHYMTEKPDEGKVISSYFFDTPVCRSYNEFYNIAVPYYFYCVFDTLKKVL